MGFACTNEIAARRFGMCEINFGNPHKKYGSCSLPPSFQGARAGQVKWTGKTIRETVMMMAVNRPNKAPHCVNL